MLIGESVEKELSSKLAEELKLEGSMDEGMEIPPSIQEYLEKGPFKVVIVKVVDIRSSILPALMKSFSLATTDPRRRHLICLTNGRITVTFSISAANFDNEMEDDYSWDEEDEGPSDGGEGGLMDEPTLPTIDSKSGRVMNKPRKSGSPLEWLLGTKMSGFGASETVAKKGKKGKKYDQESEEEEYPEEEQYDEELEGEEEWDDTEGGSRYAPINTKITITKVVVFLICLTLGC